MTNPVGRICVRSFAIVGVFTTILSARSLEAGEEQATVLPGPGAVESPATGTERLPFSISVETKAGAMFGQAGAYAENEIIIGRDFDVAHGLGIVLENKASGDVAPSVALCDEVTLVVSLGVLPFVTLGLAGKLFAEEGGVSYGVEGVVGLGYEWDDAGVSLGDESEFLLHVPGNTFEYVNTLEFSKEFPLSGTRALFVALENECAIGEGAVANTLLLGPGYRWRFLSVYANYVMTWEDDAFGHGAEAGVLFEF